MSSSLIDRLVEARIREAQARGEADDEAPSLGPLDLDDLAGLSPTQRTEALAFRTMGEVSPEVALLREIKEARVALEACGDEAGRERLRGTMREKAQQVKVLLDERRKAELDARRSELELERGRARR